MQHSPATMPMCSRSAFVALFFTRFFISVRRSAVFAFARLLNGEPGLRWNPVRFIGAERFTRPPAE